MSNAAYVDLTLEIWHTSLMKWFFVPVILVPVGRGQERKTKRDLQRLISISWSGGQGIEHAFTLLMQQKVNPTNCIQLRVHTRCFGKSFPVLCNFPILVTIQVWPSTLAAVLCRQCGHRNTYAGLWNLLLAGYAIKCQVQNNQKEDLKQIIWSTHLSWQSLEILMAQGHLRREVNRVLDTYWRGREGYAISATCYNLKVKSFDDFGFASL